MRIVLGLLWLMSVLGAGACAYVPHTTAWAQGGPVPCSAPSLRAVAAWQGVMGTIAGSVTFRNSGHSTCVLQGVPQVSIQSRTFRVSTQQIPSQDGPAGFPVRSTELVPGQSSRVTLQWENFCGLALAPVRLIIALPTRTRLAAPVAGPARYGGGGDPRCGASRKPSFLRVSSFQPAFDPGVVNLLAFYGMINRRDYTDAYAATRDAGVSLARFAAGYRRTVRVAVDRIAVPTYRVRRGDATYVCIGIQIAATQANGGHRLYAGWVMSEVRAAKIARVVIAGSRLRLGTGLLVPSKTRCGAAIPASSSAGR